MWWRGSSCRSSSWSGVTWVRAFVAFILLEAAEVARAFTLQLEQSPIRIPGAEGLLRAIVAHGRCIVLAFLLVEPFLFVLDRTRSGPRAAKPKERGAYGR
jgi:hypothetical protein